MLSYQDARKITEIVHEERLDNILSRQKITTGLCLCCSHTTKSAFLDRGRNIIIVTVYIDILYKEIPTVRSYYVSVLKI